MCSNHIRELQIIQRQFSKGSESKNYLASGTGKFKKVYVRHVNSIGKLIFHHCHQTSVTYLYMHEYQINDIRDNGQNSN